MSDDNVNFALRRLTAYTSEKDSAKKKALLEDTLAWFRDLTDDQQNALVPEFIEQIGSDVARLRRHGYSLNLNDVLDGLQGPFFSLDDLRTAIDHLLWRARG